MSTIWERDREIEKARRIKMAELMEEYDKTVYWPARKKLIEECAAEGHNRGRFHDNGFGWSWYYCSKCGTPFDKQGPTE